MKSRLKSASLLFFTLSGLLNSLGAQAAACGNHGNPACKLTYTVDAVTVTGADPCGAAGPDILLYSAAGRNSVQSDQRVFQRLGTDHYQADAATIYPNVQQTWDMTYGHLDFEAFDCGGTCNYAMPNTWSDKLRGIESAGKKVCPLGRISLGLFPYYQSSPPGVGQYEIENLAAGKQYTLTAAPYGAFKKSHKDGTWNADRKETPGNTLSIMITINQNDYHTRSNKCSKGPNC